jgi:hypothetical protein
LPQLSRGLRTIRYIVTCRPVIGAPARGRPEDIEVIMKVSAWTTSAVALCFAATLAACSSTTPTAATVGGAATSPAATGPAQSEPATPGVPAGYQRVSGPAQGVSFVAPNWLTTVDLAAVTPQQALPKLGMHGGDAAELLQDMQSLQKLHALALFAVNFVDSPAHFITNLNAYCLSSGVPGTGSAGLPALRRQVAAGMRQIHAGHIAQKDITVGGVPGLQTSYTLNSSSWGTLDGAQLEVLPKPNRGCFITFTTGQGQFEGTVLPVVAATARFS